MWCPGGQVRGLRAGLRPEAGPRPHVRGQIALGDRPAPGTLFGLRHILGDLRRQHRGDVGYLVAPLRRHRPAPHPQHAAGGQKTVSSGSSMRFIVAPGLPGCLPGRRFPRSRSDRSAPLFLYGLSEEGGRDDVDESFPAWRSNCPTLDARRSFCAVSSAISRYASTSRAARSAADRAESSSAEGTPGTPDTTAYDHHSGPPVNNPSRRVAACQPQPRGPHPQPRSQQGQAQTPNGDRS